MHHAVRDHKSSLLISITLVVFSRAWHRGLVCSFLPHFTFSPLRSFTASFALQHHKKYSPRQGVLGVFRFAKHIGSFSKTLCRKVPHYLQPASGCCAHGSASARSPASEEPSKAARGSQSQGTHLTCGCIHFLLNALKIALPNINLSQKTTESCH